MTLPSTDDKVARKRVAPSRSLHAPRFAIRRRHNYGTLSTSSVLLASVLSLQTVSAVLVPFDNCIADDWTQLQWVPMFADAVFDQTNSSNNLIVTVWGNVTGQAGSGTLPAWNSSDWNDTTKVLNGKILNNPNNANLTTLHTKVEVATYTPMSTDRNFCDNINNGSCPLGPVFSELA